MFEVIMFNRVIEGLCKVLYFERIFLFNISIFIILAWNDITKFHFFLSVYTGNLSPKNIFKQRREAKQINYRVSLCLRLKKENSISIVCTLKSSNQKRMLILSYLIRSSHMIYRIFGKISIDF
jgi:hypothetical protein